MKRHKQKGRNVPSLTCGNHIIKIALISIIYQFLTSYLMILFNIVFFKLFYFSFSKIKKICKIKIEMNFDETTI